MKEQEVKGLIHIYEGDGKGKTSTSIGLSVRCAGSGATVVFSQFLKDNFSNEVKVLKQIPGITYVESTKHFGFFFNMNEEQKEEARTYYRTHFSKIVEIAIEKKARLLVLDELISAYNLGLVDHEQVLHFLVIKPDDMEVVMTGRDPADELVALADYVSRIVKIKHPFDQGIAARKGIEY